MRNVFYYLLIGAFMACHKGSETYPSLPDGVWGDASAERNGTLWTAHPICWINQIDKTTILLNLDSLYENYYLLESLSFAGIPPKPGTYQVKKLTPENNVRAVLSMWDHDLPLGGYHILEADSNLNKLTLTSYDTLTKEIKGSFSLTFIVAPGGRPYPNYPDTIRLRNGHFHGRLIKK